MSKEDDYILPDTVGETSSTLKTDYKDEQLQIVELAPYTTKDSQESTIAVADGSESSNEGLKYMQLETSKNMLVDYLNLSFVRCENGQEEYRLVSNGDSSATVTCVLANDDGEVEGEELPRKKMKYISQSEIETQCDELKPEVNKESGTIKKTTRDWATCTEKSTKDNFTNTEKTPKEAEERVPSILDLNGCKYFGQFLSVELLRFSIDKRHAIMQKIMEIVKQ